jgi:DNA-binding response OmpR family regulator
MDTTHNGAEYPKPIVSEIPEETEKPKLLLGKKIMWVEDDRFISAIIHRKLESEGGELIGASQGEEALEIIKKTPVDIILLDIILPGMNGVQILQAIRRNPATAKTPVIMLTNLDQKEDREMCKMLGVSDFFVKASVNLDQVVARIKNILK